MGAWAEIVLWQNGKVLHSFLADEASVDIGKQFLVSSAFQNTDPQICTITKLKSGCEVKNHSFQPIYIDTTANHRPGVPHSKHSPKDLAKSESAMLFWDTAFARALKDATTVEELQSKELQSMCYSKIEFKRSGENFGIGITFVEAWEKIRKAIAAKSFGLDNSEVNRTVSLSQSDAQRFKLPVFKPSSSPLRNRSSLALILDREEARPRKSSIVRDLVNNFTTQIENKENQLVHTSSTSSLTPKSESEALPPKGRPSLRKSNALFLNHKTPVLKQSLIELDEEVKLLELMVQKIQENGHHSHHTEKNGKIDDRYGRDLKYGRRSVTDQTPPNRTSRHAHYSHVASESSPEEVILRTERIEPKIRTFSTGGMAKLEV
ncbi:unnamed protein product [Bursaphelenchus okinawaensis]|uniref:Uncharacterized protein n=1 Tax=Bursaphelenchus okinawaensis TaxID=465554 RepID=A0A811JVT3_9BILA|nr:unnamed protein product [Bursaphelenchus okinawaensis]CAG9085390.1 unnamed protein product [Bursaphelenchus okinawaensis]